MVARVGNGPSVAGTTTPEVTAVGAYKRDVEALRSADGAFSASAAYTALAKALASLEQAQSGNERAAIRTHFRTQVMNNASFDLSGQLQLDQDDPVRQQLESHLPAKGWGPDAAYQWTDYVEAFTRYAMAQGQTRGGTAK